MLKNLGVTTTVTKRGPIPPGATRGPPLGGQGAAPGQAPLAQAPPAPTAGGTPGQETPATTPGQLQGVGVNAGERDKNPGSATSFTTYGETFLSFLFAGLILCVQGPDSVPGGVSDISAEN